MTTNKSLLLHSRGFLFLKSNYLSLSIINKKKNGNTYAERSKKDIQRTNAYLRAYFKSNNGANVWVWQIGQRSHRATEKQV